MYKSLTVSLFLFLSFEAQAVGCDLKTPNDILSLIKKNHPRFILNDAQNAALRESVGAAGQILNPELDVESSKGDSIDGDVYTTSVSLKHTFELGGKRSSRVDVAKSNVKIASSISRHDKQYTLVQIILKLHRLRQVYELIPLYEESLGAFNKILRAINKRRSLSPEQQVERETLGLATNDYKLKIAQLNFEKTNLSNNLTYYMGTKCIIPRNALPYNVNLDESFGQVAEDKGYAKLNIARGMLELAKAQLELEKSNSFPDLQIGPTYEHEKVNISQTNSFGLALTMDLPIFSLNGGAKAQAAKEVLKASINVRNAKSKTKLDYQSWVSKYNQYKTSLKAIAGRDELERKHQKIESLFRRGIISTSLVIESHRQLIDFSNTRFEFEEGITEALWNIYKINGTIDNKIL